MKIFLTGCSGFIGYHLTKSLLDKGFFVFGVDNLNNYYDRNLKIDRLKILQNEENFNFIKKDINELDSINLECDIAINLAAQPGVRLNKEEYYKYDHSNIDGFKIFLNFCKRNKIPRIVYASSSSVYSGNKKIPYSERDKILNPTSRYAETKLVNENLAEQITQKEKMKAVGLRFFTVYGPFGRPDMAYYFFTKNILENKEIPIFNNGNTYRDMTYIDDIINGINLSLNFVKKQKTNHEIFNLGNNKPIETLSLIKYIENEFSAKAKIKNIFAKDEVHKTFANIEKAQSILGYNPKINFEAGIKFFFDWYRHYYKL